MGGQRQAGIAMAQCRPCATYFKMVLQGFQCTSQAANDSWTNSKVAVAPSPLAPHAVVAVVVADACKRCLSSRSRSSLASRCACSSLTGAAAAPSAICPCS